MIKISIVALALGLLMFSSVSASAAGGVKANVPFAFHAGTVMLPAGEYVFSMGWHSDLVVTYSSGSHACILPMVREQNLASAGYRVIFTKYGDEYFLSEVRSRDFHGNLPKTQAEKMLAMAASRQPVIVAVSDLVGRRCEN